MTEDWWSWEVLRRLYLALGGTHRIASDRAQLLRVMMAYTRLMEAPGDVQIDSATGEAVVGG